MLHVSSRIDLLTKLRIFLRIQVDQMDGIQMKQMVEAALAQIDATGSPPSSMSY